MGLEVRYYIQSDAAAFRDLNVAWITAHFTMDAKDREVLENPGAMVIGRGGRILIAEEDGAAVGTLALIPVQPGQVELCKMAVSPGLRGKGIGRALLEAADDAARNMGATSIWLEANKVLDAAISLYRSCGYAELTDDAPAYDPGSTQFVKTL